MKNVVKYFLLMFLLIPCICFAESTNFQPTYEVDTEIKDNYLYIMLGYEGDDIENIDETIAFKTGTIELTSIDAMNGYSVKKQELTKDGKYTKINLSIENAELATNKNYAILEFKVNNTKYTDLFFYNIDGLNIKSKFRNNGNILALRKDNDLMITTKKDITSSTKTQYFFINNMNIFIIIGVCLFICLMVFINLPSKKKKTNDEERKDYNEEIDSSFYNKDI